MKSANITSLSPMGEMAKAPAKPVAKGDDDKKSLDFKQVINQSIGQSAKGNTPDTQKATTGNTGERSAQPTQSPAKDNTIQKNDQTQSANANRQTDTKDDTDTASEVTVDGATDAVQEESAVSEVVSEVASEMEEAALEATVELFGISKEQIEDAMEVLGLSYVELLNPANMQNLMLEVAGEDVTVNPDILDATPEDLSGMLSEALDTTFESAPVSLEEGSIIISDLIPADDTVLQDQVANLLKLDPKELRDLAVEMGRMAEEASGEEPVDPTIPVQQEAAEDMSAMIPQDLAARRVERTVTYSEVKIINVVDEPTEGNMQGVEEIPDAAASKIDFSEMDLSEEYSDEGTMEFEENVPAKYVPEEQSIQVTTGQQAVPQTFADMIRAQSQPQPVAQPQAYTSVPVSDVMDQIVLNASATINDEVRRMEIELNPQALGRMIMQVQEHDGAVTARLVTQNEAVKEALEAQMNVLRENLNNRGIRVEAVEVTVATHEFEQNLEEGQQSNEQMEEQQQGQTGQGANTRNLNVNELEDLQGELTEEEELAARIMQDEGNTLNYRA